MNSNLRCWVFTVPGKATAKGSARAAAVPVTQSPKCPECGKHEKHRALVFKEKATETYENLVKMAAYQAGVEMCECVELIVVIGIPCKVKIYKTKPNILERPLMKPDVDNVNKAVQDGLQGIAYKNDKLVDATKPIISYLSPLEAPFVRVTIIERHWTEFLAASALEYLDQEVRRYAKTPSIDD